jgi:hypothetical protein
MLTNSTNKTPKLSNEIIVSYTLLLLEICSFSCTKMQTARVQLVFVSFGLEMRRCGAALHLGLLRAVVVRLFLLRVLERLRRRRQSRPALQRHLHLCDIFVVRSVH